MKKSFYSNSKLYFKKYKEYSLLILVISLLSPLALLVVFYSFLKAEGLKDIVGFYFFLAILSFGVIFGAYTLRYFTLYKRVLLLTDAYLELRGGLPIIDLLKRQTINFKDILRIYAGPDYFDEKLGLKTLFILFDRTEPPFDNKVTYEMRFEGLKAEDAQEIANFVNTKIKRNYLQSTV